MKKFDLGRSQVLLVDDDIAVELQALLDRGAVLSNQRGYPAIRIDVHRLVLPHKSSRQSHIDHVNGDRLDARRDNLRVATPAQNQANRKKAEGKTSRYKGVSRTRRGKWYAQITVNYVAINLGTFACEEEAARAYDAAAVEHFGDFARLNFPGPGLA